MPPTMPFALQLLFATIIFVGLLAVPVVVVVIVGITS